jgi:hypothetical protein
MLEADLAITGGELMTMGDAGRLEAGTVLVRGQYILAVGSDDSLGPWRAPRILDARDRVVLPGFSNCHTHIGSNVLLRGLNEDAKLFEWLASMWRLKQNFDHETLRLASLAGLAEMALAGITSFNEHFDAYAVTPEISALDTLPCARRWATALRISASTPMCGTGRYAALARFGDIVDAYHGSRDGRLRVALSPHATYSCTEQLWRRCAEVAEEYDLASTRTSPRVSRSTATSLNSTAARRRHGCTAGPAGPRLTAAHCTTLTDADDHAPGRAPGEGGALPDQQRQAVLWHHADSQASRGRRDRRPRDRWSGQPQYAGHVPGDEVRCDHAQEPPPRPGVPDRGGDAPHGHARGGPGHAPAGGGYARGRTARGPDRRRPEHGALRTALRCGGGTGVLEPRR